MCLIGSGVTNASQWAKTINRCKQTVLEWVCQYNGSGPTGIVYQRSGGRRSKLNESEQKQLAETVKQDKPRDHQLPGYGWTLKKLRRWVETKLKRPVSCTTLRSYLKRAGLSWKKSKKVLAKANPQKRAEFVERFQSLFEQVCQEEIRLIYLDEVHVHQDMDLGYHWSAVGEADWVLSYCPRSKIGSTGMGPMTSARGNV